MEINFFDQGCRHLVSLDAPGSLAWLLGIPETAFRFVRWEDTRNVPFPGDYDRTNDRVAVLEDLSTPSAPWLMPLEFQVEPDAKMFGRLLGYLSGLWLTCKPDDGSGSRYNVSAVVVNLTGRGYASRSMAWPGTGQVTQVDVKERNLRDESADELLGAIDAGRTAMVNLPWISLMRGGNDPDLIEAWKTVAEREPIQSNRRAFAYIATMFAQKTDCFEIWERALEDWNVEIPRIVEEYTDKKLRQEKASDLKKYLRRFGAIPFDIERRIDAIRDFPILTNWLDLAFDIDSIEAFRIAIADS